MGKLSVSIGKKKPVVSAKAETALETIDIPITNEAEDMHVCPFPADHVCPTPVEHKCVCATVETIVVKEIPVEKIVEVPGPERVVTVHKTERVEVPIEKEIIRYRDREIRIPVITVQKELKTRSAIIIGILSFILGLMVRGI